MTEGLQNINFIGRILLNALGMLSIELKPIMYDIFPASVAGPSASVMQMLGGSFASLANSLM